jgi:uncharacterized protein (DUF1501 family)
MRIPTNVIMESARHVFRPDGPAGDVLVVALLRGGADGLHLVPPHADDEYFRQRPRIAPLRPDKAEGIVDLDGFFGLHPKMLPLLDHYRSGNLAIVQACGSPDQTLSHFSATRILESGAAGPNEISTGWIGRHFGGRGPANASPLQALAFSGTMPQILSGAAGAVTLRSLADLRFDLPRDWASSFPPLLASLYANGNDPVSQAGRDSLEMLRNLARLRPEAYRPERGADYPIEKFGQDMKQVAQLIKAEIGLEAAILELDGWDSHIRQSQLDGLMSTLAKSLAAIATDLGDRMRRVTVVAVSEFGRRVRENSAEGTDHGRATAMFLMGGQVRGGRVYGRWPGLAADQIDASGNLAVTTDYRSVFAELVQRRLRNADTARIFPSFRPQFLDIFSTDVG